MIFKNLSLKTKILLIVLCGPIFLAVLLSWLRVDASKTAAIENIVAKSQSIVLMAEATRNEMARKIELGVIRPFSDIAPDKIIEAVPVVTAMQAAAINAEKAGYQFRAPKVQPRNPKNTPTAEEREILDQMKKENKEEITIIRDNQVVYFKAIRLTEDCLVCHGDPRGEKDPSGGIKEGWRAGEIHGAFEIISSLDETHATIRKNTISVILFTLAILAAITGISWFLIRSNVIKPLFSASNFIQDVSRGNLSKKWELKRKDEFGIIATALNEMVASLNSMVQDITRTTDFLNTSSRDLEDSADQYEKGAQNLNDRSTAVAAAAEEMSVNMSNVAAATEEASTNISLVSNAARDMSATINEISANTEKTQTIASNAVAQAETASRSVDELGHAAQKIGVVTETITEISEQTNLLALNATIEAARAGEAGKGFAVVANEIKELAKQTAEATNEIREQIAGIQKTTANTVTEIENITKVINEVNEIVVIVVAAVEEQNVTTNEIAENIEQATIGIQEVTENVSQSSVVSEEVAQEVSQVSAESDSIVERSRELSQKAGSLHELAAQLTEITKKFQV